MSDASKIDPRPAPEPRGDAAPASGIPWEEDLSPPTAPRPAADEKPLVVAAAPPTDDTPTVISKNHFRTSTPEEVAASIRGKRLAHFELIAPVGVGGMAAVLMGRDLLLDRTVALKILPPEMAKDPENVRRFHQEARAAAKLDHENIARVFYCGEDQGLHFIAFEFVQGENLRALLERRGRLPVGEAINYLLQVATGLAHAASRGVVHRDIKPSNIIISPTGRAKLVDMGLARSQAPQDDRGLTQSGVTLGTFDYISPEQALEPREADVRSDIYSLGCTFYHMLTGQPPVPEGTAAKKLHHHQQVPPVDPRQLNPAVPDEAAAILARMMAKEPRERYQRAEHLVQHLIRAAQNLDAGAVTTDSVLFVDAPLPAPPARWPVVSAALAIAAVVALVFALEQFPTGPRPPLPSSGLPVAADTKGITRPLNTSPDVRPSPPVENGKGEVPPPAPSAPRPFDFDDDKTVKDLRDLALASTPDRNLEIVLHKDLDLSAGDDADSPKGGLEFRGRHVIIRAADGSRPTIRLTYDGSRPDPRLWTALRLDAERVTLRGLRIVLNARRPAFDLRMTGVHLPGGAGHRIEDCRFVQQFPPYDENYPLCSVWLGPMPSLNGPRADWPLFSVKPTVSPGEVPSLNLARCVFAGLESPPKETSEKEAERSSAAVIGRGGHVAIARHGPGHLTATDCVFGPHLNCFRLDGKSTPQRKDVDLEHCSLLLADGSTAFRQLGEAGCRVSVTSCLFARAGRPVVPSTPGALGHAALLVRQDGAGSADLQYHGEDNRYFNLDGFWADSRRGVVTAADWKEFEAKLRPQNQDARSRVLGDGPWAGDPLAAIAECNFALAFRVKRHALDLRVPGLVNSNLIGAEKCEGVLYLTNLPKLKPQPPDAVARKEKVVDPTVELSNNGIYKGLAPALAEAKAGDVILLRHNGPLKVKPITLGRPDLDVTIRPAAGFRPVLVLDASELDSSLFRLLEGKLLFQRIEFRLEPGASGTGAAPSQAVAAILRDGVCRFEECIITLADARDARLAAVVLPKPDTVMKKESAPGQPAPAGPSILFDRCFVRGKGDLVWCRSSRPFTLEAHNTLAAVSGSLLRARGKDGTAGRRKATVRLNKVTAAVGGHLLNLQAEKSLTSLAPLEWDAVDCLFVSPGGRSLVHLSGLESPASETALKEALAWTSANNAYGKFMWMLEQHAGLTDMAQPYDRQKWQAFTGETDATFLDKTRVFPDAPDISGLADARPSQFTAAGLNNQGANLDQLPAPARADRRETALPEPKVPE